MSCANRLHSAFCVIFSLCGIVLIGLGAHGIVTLKKWQGTESSQKEAIAAIVVGTLKFVVGSCGCREWITQNCRRLIIFSVLIGVLVAIELSLGFLCAVYRNEVVVSLKNYTNVTFENYKKNDTVAKKTWDDYQRFLKCCGFEHATDYGSSPIPPSCCLYESCTLANAYTEGCKQKIEDFMKGTIDTMAGAGIALGLTEIIGIVLACCLAKAVAA